MTLFELLEQSKGSEFTIWDKDYDIEFYMEYCDGKDEWDKAMMKLAKVFKAEEISPDGVTCNVSETIEKFIGQPEFDKLFIDSDIDAIMDDFDAIMAGNVSEGWMKKFADIISR